MDNYELFEKNRIKKYKIRILILLKRWIFIRILFITLLSLNLLTIGINAHGLSLLAIFDGLVSKKSMVFLNIWFIAWYIVFILTAIFIRYKLSKDKNLTTEKYNKILMIYFILAIFFIFSIIVAPMYIYRLEKIKEYTLNNLYQ